MVEEPVKRLNTGSKIAIGFRLISMFVDHMIMTAIIVPPLILMDLIFGSGQLFEKYPYETLAFNIMLLVYINKDFANGKSISKRILGLQVVDRQTGKPANALQCFLRNMIIPIAMPLEVIVTIFSPTRRIGDLISNTQISFSEKQNVNTILTDLKKTRLNKITLSIIVLSVLYVWSLPYLEEMLF